MKRVVLLAAVALFLGGCSYLGTMVRQGGLQARSAVAPRQRDYKHMLTRRTYYVFGQVGDHARAHGVPVAVAGVSDTPRPGEVVDICHSVRSGSYYGLHLPAGAFRLLVLRDFDRDGFYTANEVTALRSLRLDPVTAPELVLAGFDLGSDPASGPPPANLRITVRPDPARRESVWFPRGTLRTLDDPLFAPDMAALGLYEPARFLEAAPMMFYALEEDLGYKVPVIFVHGINGSARDFADIVAHLDRRRYRPWFFYYPSGAPLAQLGEMFYRIFLSGRTIPRQETPVVIVAHSMGGLVVREALNRLGGSDREMKVGRLVTLASPIGGHPAAARAARAPVVIPSWRDLDPAGKFVHELHRRPLPASARWHLISVCNSEPGTPDGDKSDGVVPLRSQLDPAAVHEAAETTTVAASHAGVLSDPIAVAAIVQAVEEVKSPFREDHLRELDRGGYAMELPPDFSAMETFFVRYLGRYMDALVSGRIPPDHPEQIKFVQACREKRAAGLPAAEAWLKLDRNFPRRQ